jgi:predicted dienelactone hydrolase
MNVRTLLRSLKPLVFIVAILLLAGCGVSDDSPYDEPSSEKAGEAELLEWPPDALGPYSVGVKTIYLADESRHEIWGDLPRSLPLEIWYPSAGEGDVNTVETMIGEVPDWAVKAFAEVYGDGIDDLLDLETAAGRNAPILKTPGGFPLILFSHGLSAIRFQNFTLCEHLASHGFIVVSPDHYANAIFTNIPDVKVVIFNPLSVVAGVIDRPLDVDFIYRSLQELSINGPWVLPPMDFDRFGVTGHSYGGLTAMLVGPMYDYVDAIAAINPAFFSWYPETFNRPFLMLQSSLDEIVGQFNEPARQAFQMAGSAHKLYLKLPRGGHYSATDACALLPPSLTPGRGCNVPNYVTPALANELSAAYITAFFQTFVAEKPQYEPYMLENHYPEELIHKAMWPTR